MITAKVRGLSELANALKQLPPEIASKNGGPLRTALGKAARQMRDAAKAKAPVDSGNLRDNIIAVRDRNPEARGATEAQFVTVRRGSKPKKGSKARKGAYYASMVEFGTSKQAAQPFLRPAFEEGKGKAVETLASELGRAIDRAARKLNRGPRA